jgi:hypothetical protein
MTLFLLLALALSAALIGLGYMMDANAIKARINGANGLPLLAAVLVSGAGLVVVAVICGIWAGPALAFGVLGASLLWHFGALRLAVWHLQRKASRSKA